MRRGNQPSVRLLVAALLLASGVVGAQTQVVTSEFIFDTAPFPSCHASTIANPIQRSSQHGSAARVRALMTLDLDLAAHGADNRWSPRWKSPRASNRRKTAGPVEPGSLPIPNRPADPFFTKLGPPPTAGGHDESSATAVKRGRSVAFADGILGPIKDKAVLLPDGTLLCPSSTEDHGWQIHMEFTATSEKPGRKRPR